MNFTYDFTQALLSLDGLAAKQILDDHFRRTNPVKFFADMAATLEYIEIQWQEGNLALSQAYMGGQICEDMINKIPLPADPAIKDQPKMAICVLLDHNKLGKMIVYSLLRASGFELSDYNTIMVDDLVERVKNENIEILLISVLTLPSAIDVKKVKSKLTQMGCDVKIIVGGAPFRFNAHLWQEVGADVMCGSASEAVCAVHNIMGIAT